MNDVTHTLHEVIRKQLHQSDFDIVGIVPIPTHGDRMVRLRTLQEMIEEFEEANGQGTIEYLLQIKPRRATPSAPPKNDVAPVKPAIQESIYLANGKLNVPYLVRNADLLFDSGDFPLARN